MFEKNRVFSPINPLRANKSLYWDVEPNNTVRIINSAIYIEEPKTSTASLKKSNRPPTPTSTKRCCCYSSSLKCPCHSTMSEINFSEYGLKSLPSKTWGRIEVEEKLSPTPTVSTIYQMDAQEKEENLKKWVARKAEEKRKKRLAELKIKEAKANEKQAIVERERESFKNWLVEKKKEEETKRRGKELELQQQKLKEVEKEKRTVQNDLCYFMWLQNKKKIDLEKKLSEKISFLKECEEKKKRIENNEMAFKAWVENSKIKARPIPLNQGLKSLCSSMSVTYINPIPWQPNIDKPYSE